MKKLEISKIKSKLKEWARSWISLDWEKTNIWEKRQNTVFAFFPCLPIIIFYTFKEGSIIANILQSIIVMISLEFLFHVIKSRRFIKRFFLVCQALLTLTISALILSRLLKPSDLGKWLQLISSFLFLETTIIAIIVFFYENNPNFLKIKSWIRFLFLIVFLLFSFVVIFLFSEMSTTNAFIITAVYGISIKLMDSKTFLSVFCNSEEEIDLYEIKKEVKEKVELVKILTTFFYLSLLIMTSVSEKFCLDSPSFCCSSFFESFVKAELIAAIKFIITCVALSVFIGFYGYLTRLIRKNDLKNKWFDKIDKSYNIDKISKTKRNKVRRRLSRYLSHQ